MKIGILSDTHGHLAATRLAAQKLAAEKVDAVFHCGDMGDEAVLVELAAIFQPLEVPIYAVFGNVDRVSNDWKFLPSNLGVEIKGRWGEVPMAGKKIAFLHGDDSKRFQATVASGAYDLVLFGHSHEVADFSVGKTRCLNPGSVSRGRGSPNSCAVFDLDTEEFSVLLCE